MFVIILERKIFFFTADCYASIKYRKKSLSRLEAIFHIWIIQHHYLLESSSFLSKPAIFLYEKNVHVSHFAWRKDSRIPRGWMGLTYWKGTFLLAKQRKRTLDLCRLNETRNAALSSANDVNAVADFVFGSILFTICKPFFFQHGWLISILSFEFSINSKLFLHLIFH